MENGKYQRPGNTSSPGLIFFSKTSFTNNIFFALPTVQFTWIYCCAGEWFVIDNHGCLLVNGWVLILLEDLTSWEVCLSAHELQSSWRSQLGEGSQQLLLLTHQCSQPWWMHQTKLPDFQHWMSSFGRLTDAIRYVLKQGFHPSMHWQVIECPAWSYPCMLWEIIYKYCLNWNEFVVWFSLYIREGKYFFSDDNVANNSSPSIAIPVNYQFSLLLFQKIVLKMGDKVFFNYMGGAQ